MLRPWAGSANTYQVVSPVPEVSTTSRYGSTCSLMPSCGTMLVTGTGTAEASSCCMALVRMARAVNSRLVGTTRCTPRTAMGSPLGSVCSAMSCNVVCRLAMVSGSTPTLVTFWPSTSAMGAPNRPAAGPAAELYSSVTCRASVRMAALAKRSAMSENAPMESLMTDSQEMSNWRPYLASDPV